MPKELHLDDAALKAYRSVAKMSQARKDILIEALLTPELAKDLGVEHLVYRDHRVPDRNKKTARKAQVVTGVREGFTEIDLERSIGQAFVEFHPRGMKQHLGLSVDRIGEMRAKKLAKGGVRLFCKLTYTGKAEVLAGYHDVVGEAPGEIRIRSREGEQLTIEHAAKPANGKRGRKKKDSPQLTIDDAIAANGDADVAAQEKEIADARKLRGKGKGFVN